MHANAFDRYQPGLSPVHQLDPRVKLVVTVLFILSNALLPDQSWLAFCLAWGLLVLCNAASGLGAAFTFRRSFIALPFALMASTVLFSLPGKALFTLDTGLWQWVVTDAGLARFSSILARSWLSVQVAILLVATTPFPDLAHALRHLRAPEMLVSVISFMYRYLFILTDEALRLLRARAARSARMPGIRSTGSLGWRGRIAGNMAGQLFLRSYERSDRVYSAMLSRGYAGQLFTLNPHEMRSRDWAAGAALIAILVLLQVIARLSL